jgi:hypothetical protein
VAQASACRGWLGLDRSRSCKSPLAEEAAEKLQNCHPEGRVCPRDLLFSQLSRKSRFLASLGMTKGVGAFSAVSEACATSLH